MAHTDDLDRYVRDELGAFHPGSTPSQTEEWNQKRKDRWRD
jgi:hypothetical protein